VPLTNAEMRTLAARGTTLRERLGGNLIAVPSEVSDSLAQVRLERWKAMLGEGFARRLVWDGIEEADAVRALGSMAPPRDAEAPEWVRLLDAVLDCREEIAFSPALPFEEIAAPFVHVAGAGVPGTALRWRLAHRLTQVAAGVLLAQFERHRGPRPQGNGSPPREAYARFVEGLRGGGLKSVFTTFAAIAREMAEATLTWRTQTDLFVERKNDLPSTEIEADVIRTPHGDYFYEPRPDAAELVDWISEVSGTPTPKTIGFVWILRTEHHARRLGARLAILRAVGAAHATDPAQVPETVFRHLGTDWIEPAPAPPAANAEQLIEGFRDAARALTQIRRQARVPWRPRPLAEYAALQQAQGNAQRQGVDRSLALEILLAPLVESAERPPLWPIARAEIQALERGEIPHFEYDMNTGLVDGSIPMEVAVKPYTESEIAAQVEALRAALALR